MPGMQPIFFVSDLQVAHIFQKVNGGIRNQARDQLEHVVSNLNSVELVDFSLRIVLSYKSLVIGSNLPLISLTLCHSEISSPIYERRTSRVLRNVASKWSICSIQAERVKNGQQSVKLGKSNLELSRLL
jgi:hypothetical protein